MPTIAITIISSIKVKPFCMCVFMEILVKAADGAHWLTS
jgi:hypothetical protein